MFRSNKFCWEKLSREQKLRKYFLVETFSYCPTLAFLEILGDMGQNREVLRERCGMT